MRRSVEGCYSDSRLIRKLEWSNSGPCAFSLKTMLQSPRQRINFRVMTTIRLGSVALDCADPIALATFWANLLGGAVVYTSDDFVAVQLEGLWISTMKVENYEPPVWPLGSPPKQMHLDLATNDLDQSEREALRLGAVKCELQPQPERWRVLVDPAGHPFCLTTQIPE